MTQSDIDAAMIKYQQDLSEYNRKFTEQIVAEKTGAIEDRQNKDKQAQESDKVAKFLADHPDYKDFEASFAKLYYDHHVPLDEAYRNAKATHEHESANKDVKKDTRSPTDNDAKKLVSSAKTTTGDDEGKRRKFGTAKEAAEANLDKLLEAKGYSVEDL